MISKIKFVTRWFSHESRQNERPRPAVDLWRLLGNLPF